MFLLDTSLQGIISTGDNHTLFTASQTFESACSPCIETSLSEMPLFKVFQ